MVAVNLGYLGSVIGDRNSGASAINDTTEEIIDSLGDGGIDAGDDDGGGFGDDIGGGGDLGCCGGLDELG